MKNKLCGALLILVLAAVGAARASAQVDVSPGVARVSLVRGDVSTQRGDSGDWNTAVLNQPVVTGDKVSTGADSRAELQLDYANILRLADNSQVTVADLSRNRMQVQLGQGLADFTVLKDSEVEVEIDTPNVAVRPARRDGVYRIEVNTDGETRVIVRRGEAEISTPQGSTRVQKGEMASIRGAGDNTVYRVDDAPSTDSWDSWNNDRDNVIYRAQSWNRTNRYYVGSENLDAYGRWVNVPDYGPVWQPVVASGWAPYRDGRWVWEPYWGWTWVSYEPWGWAPYHYGRWFLHNSAWVWWPGPVYGYRHYRPLWAPAYVSFFGFGGGNWGFSAGFGFGSVGWLPAGPGDPFFPWYGGHRSRFNVVNITNVTNITNITNIRTVGGIPPLRSTTGFSNLRRATTDPRLVQAISTVPANRFGAGRVSALPATREIVRDGRLMTGNLPIVPTRAALSASNRPANPSTLRGGEGQRFFTKARPVAAPVSFDREASQLQREIQRSRFTPIRAEAGSSVQKPDPVVGARTSGDNPAGTMRVPTKIGVAEANRGTTPENRVSPARPAENPGRTASPVPDRSWRRFDNQLAENRTPETPQRSAGKPASPAPRNEQRANPRAAAPDQSGWRRFGDNRQDGNRSAAPVMRQENRGTMNQSRPEFRSPASAPPARVATPNRSEGWRQFTPAPRSAAPASPSREIDRGNRFPSQSESRSVWGSRSSGSFGRSSRPPLDLRQPIVTPRSGMTGGREMPSYRNNGGYRPAPSGGGGPRGYAPSSRPHGGSGGQSRPPSGRR